MARPKNENVPEDAVTLATKVAPDLASKVRILAIVEGQSVSDLLAAMLTEKVEAANVTISVNGKPLETPAA